MFYQCPVDQYGFERPENFDYDNYEKFMENYFAVLTRRADRWNQILGDPTEKEKLKNYLKGRQFKRFVRKGIPREHRALVWMVSSGAQTRMDENPVRYQELLSSPKDAEVMDQINLDLHRTFPDNIYFKRKPGEGGSHATMLQVQAQESPLKTSSNSNLSPGDQLKLGQLKNVLTAFAHQNTAVGYCQGLNFVTGVLLLIVEDEECAFWLLDALVTHILPDYYSRDMMGLRSDTLALGELVSSKMSEVASLLMREGVTWDLVCSRWFLCLYIDILPIETVLRVWDVLFNEGSKILFRVALTLIKNAEPKLLTCQNFPSIISTFKGMMQDPLALHCHAFLQSIFEKENTGRLSSKMIEQFRECSRQKVEEGDAQMNMARK